MQVPLRSLQTLSILLKFLTIKKEVLLKIIDAHSLSCDSREAWALNLIEEEEVMMAKSLEKVDIVTRIGPTLGLMGTLIPMGPGLAALGSGDVTTLANAIIVAFDTTVVGIGSGAIAYVISKSGADGMRSIPQIFSFL